MGVKKTAKMWVIFIEGKNVFYISIFRYDIETSISRNTNCKKGLHAVSHVRMTPRERFALTSSLRHEYLEEDSVGPPKCGGDEGKADGCTKERQTLF